MKKSTYDWLKEHPHTILMDPNGWKIDNKSMYEPITLEEFQERLSNSTVIIKHKLNMNYKEFITANKEVLSKGTVYLSGPISSIGFTEARKRFSKIAEILKEDDIIAVGTSLSLNPSYRVKSVYLKNGITIMNTCSSVIIVGDNKDSSGSKLEENIALELGMPVFYIDISKGLEKDKLTII